MNDVLISPKKTDINELDCDFCNDVVCYNNIKKKSNEPNDIRESFIDKSTYDEDTENGPNLECIICFEKNQSPIVTCSLCSNYSHYTCYKKFTKKNAFYKMKCVHCGTRSVRFSKKWWQLWCCYTQTK